MPAADFALSGHRYQPCPRQRHGQPCNSSA